MGENCISPQRTIIMTIFSLGRASYAYLSFHIKFSERPDGCCPSFFSLFLRDIYLKYVYQVAGWLYDNKTVQQSLLLVKQLKTYYDIQYSPMPRLKKEKKKKVSLNLFSSSINTLSAVRSMH